jgi:site-specific DNA-adenine methylase
MFFYLVSRGMKFNAYLSDTTAGLIALNKTGYNGHYRVNKKGEIQRAGGQI